MLSGGNQQKIALGKMMQVEPDIVILDEPAGYRCGNETAVYLFVRELVKQGKSCILISSELSEIIGLVISDCDAAEGFWVSSWAMKSMKKKSCCMPPALKEE